MSQRYDVVIAGLGAMGSSAAYHLAGSGLKILGLDRFAPPHSQGSSHGQTRIIREAYWEHPLYVPLVRRAYELWARLEQESGRELYRRTGGLMIGRPEEELIEGTLRSIDEYKIAHEILTVEEIRRRYPAINIPHERMIGVLEHKAGILFPELCVDTHLNLARKHGAEIHFDEPVNTWQLDGEGVRISTSKGEYLAGRLLISAGAWAGSLLAELNLPLSVERQVLLWLKPSGDHSLFGLEKLPIFLWGYQPGHMIYGFPDIGDGLKIAFHHNGQTVTPEDINRSVSDEEVESHRAILRQFMPEADGDLLSAAVCMYTNTPDGHFLIDFHPESDRVLLASPCSGHGFKFSSVIGEILCDMLLEGESAFDISPFRLDRTQLS
ncbi:MAG: N-methyl-L-tryptophan oxidase [Acidobacteria bacterium]|nr:N-methyl-L-tryptophan oxidase [Acidobacteriota bacterium]